jgi:hypothetical protein
METEACEEIYSTEASECSEMKRLRFGWSLTGMDKCRLYNRHAAFLLGAGLGGLPLGTRDRCLDLLDLSGVVPVVRAEGLAELAGDIVIICTGGTLTPAA